MSRHIDLQPTLSGTYLTLRPLQESDFEALYLAASDPLIWEQHPQPTRYRREVFAHYFDSAIVSKGALAAIDRTNGEIIGSSRYCNYVEVNREIEIGWTFLARKYWGGKYNGEMKRMMLDHIFQYVDRVLFEIGSSNVRSRKAVERIGAKFICEIPPPTDGSEYTPYVRYAIEHEHA